jgi:hypothetical protein
MGAIESASSARIIGASAIGGLVRTSIFAFATDLHDEGLDSVLDSVTSRGGVGGVTMAVSYHHGRDIFPHNPARKVHFLEGGAVFFRPELSVYEGPIQPHVSRLAQEHDVFAAARQETERRSIELHAWTVFLHNTTLGTRHPECAVRNAFDDAYVTDLCPANPDVRRYAVSLAADIMRYRPETVLAESLHYHPLQHGFHHERYFVDLGATARFLLGLCFCEHCVARARQHGLDGAKVKEEARIHIQRAFDVAPIDEGVADVEGEDMRSLFDGRLGEYLDMRVTAVTTLAADVAAEVDSHGGRFTFMDLSGAVKGYATGRPEGAPAPSIAWRLGVDISHLASVCHGIEAIGYAYEPDRLRLDLSAYLELIDGKSDFSVALRPMDPDCDSADNLAAKLVLGREFGLIRADFYHYGFMRLSTLDRIQEALAR